MGRMATIVAGMLAAALAGCGTTYEMEALDEAAIARANAEIAAERARASAAGDLEVEERIALYEEVAGNVEPMAETFCYQETEAGTDCDFALVLDRDPAAGSNAYQSYAGARPTLTITLAFLEEVEAPDELAFVIGHEAGHHIAGHLKKKKTQQAVGALLGGLAVLALGAGSRQVDRQQLQRMMAQGAALGAAGGSMAYNQTYELEADMLGAYITESAGYDPDLGSRIFARLGVDRDAVPAPGTAAFWSTHPSSPERIATVDAVLARIAAERAKGEVPVPPRKEEE